MLTPYKAETRRPLTKAQKQANAVFAAMRCQALRAASPPSRPGESWTNPGAAAAVTLTTADHQRAHRAVILLGALLGSGGVLAAIIHLYQAGLL